MKLKYWTLLAVLALAAIPALAQDGPRFFYDEPITGESSGWAVSSSYSTGQYMDNPCTAAQDYYWVDYAAYVEGAQKEAGIDQYLVKEDTNMGGAYVAAGSAASDVSYGRSFTLRNYHKVNTYDNFHVVTIVNFDPVSRSTNLAVETACGNGMPDSKE